MSKIISIQQSKCQVLALDKLAIGSIRSPGNYDIRLLLEPIDDILQNWDGHKNALGFSLQRSLWEQFIDRLEIEIGNIVCVDTQDNEPLVIDAELPHAYIAPVAYQGHEEKRDMMQIYISYTYV